jgi:hypothetical protein
VSRARARIRRAIAAVPGLLLFAAWASMFGTVALVVRVARRGAQ